MSEGSSKHHVHMAGPILATVFAFIWWVLMRSTQNVEPDRWARRGVSIDEIPGYRAKLFYTAWGFRLFLVIAVVTWIVFIATHLA